MSASEIPPTATPPRGGKTASAVQAQQPKPEVKDRLINPRAAYDWSRISNELDEAGLSLSAFRVYFNLLRRSDKHFTCYPGGRRIAEDCGLNRETVIKALHELETRGMLQINRNWGRSSDYEILPLSSWKDKDGNLKYPPEPVGKTDRSENPNGPVGKTDTNRIQSTESKETTTTPCVSAPAEAELSVGPAPSSFSSVGGVSEELSGNLSPQNRLELDAIALEFDSDGRQKAKAEACAKRRGMAFVREQANIVRLQQTRLRNLAGAFEKACDSPEGWKRPKLAASKKPARKVEPSPMPEPPGAPAPEPLTPEQQQAMDATRRALLDSPRNPSPSPEAQAKTSAAEARYDRMKQRWDRASVEERTRWIAQGDPIIRKHFRAEGPLPMRSLWSAIIPDVHQEAEQPSQEAVA